MLDQVATGVLTTVVIQTGRRLGATASLMRSSRDAEQLAIVKWFDTYRITRTVPELTDCTQEQLEQLSEHLEDDEVQAVLHELLAARLTDAPELDVARVRTAFLLSLDAVVDESDEPAAQLFDFFDEEICTLVGKLEGSEPALLGRVRQEALASRMIAILGAIERHTTALETRLDRQAEANYLAGYRRHLIDHHGRLEPPDFERRRKIPVADLYVPPTIVAFGQVEPGNEPRELDLWELDDEIDRTVLLGDPGGGKTTAAQVLIHRHAENSRRPIPFLVTLREFAAQAPPEHSVVAHIENKLNRFYQHPAPPGLVEGLLLSGRAVVIFDGLDELLDTSRRVEVTEIVERFATEYPQASVLVTSRVIGYEQARLDDRHFVCFRIDRFADVQVGEYVSKWFAQDGGSAVSAEEIAAAFLDESSTISDLRANPLLLALMCILYRGEGSLPRNRYEVYEKCANLLLSKWDGRRHLYSTFRAAHLLEAALRHLAHWMFTHPQNKSAVTERELIAETISFLHGPGFENETDARDAATQFVELCRGRWWVFTDTGTTASGESLYSFTHRTFLEYFTAAHLAFAADTPEHLARIIAPRVARHEWEVVAELAAQIKDRTSRDGARRIYTTLLGDRRYSTSKSCGAILEFLARSLRSVDPSPQTTRELTRRILDHFFSGDPQESIYYGPLVWLLGCCVTYREVVDDEIANRAKDLAMDENPNQQCLGLSLAVFLADALEWPFESGPELPASHSLIGFWRQCTDRNVALYKDQVTAAAARNPGLMHIALTYDLIEVDDVLRFSDGLTALFRDVRSSVVDMGWTSRVDVLLRVIIAESGNAFHRDGRNAFLDAAHAFKVIGQYLLDNPALPWTGNGVSGWYPTWFKLQPPTPTAQSLHDSTTYLGASACLLTMAEATSSEWLPPRDKLQFGFLNDLRPYVKCRWKLEAGQSLPPLPVPDVFQKVFVDWAHRKVDFIGDHK